METVGVLGTGTMGAGIVQVVAQAGYRVVACDRSVEALERAQLYVRDGLGRFAGKGAITESEAATAYDRIHWTVNAEEMGEAGAVIEAVVERVGPKKEALGALDALLPPGSLILTNTSSISITDLANACPTCRWWPRILPPFGHPPAWRTGTGVESALWRWLRPPQSGTARDCLPCPYAGYWCEIPKESSQPKPCYAPTSVPSQSR
jgi:3-hydroxyacyl-CoA dehydrogenase, NAD binding domain